MDFVVECLVCFQSIWLVLFCPYTKVEESFNLQAMHDLIYHGTDLEKYDHREFPGVVPRTFLGPITVSAIAYPFTMVVDVAGQPKIVTQYIVRAILGLLVTGTFVLYSRSIRAVFGLFVSRFLCVITLTQFHFLFYSSRPLPNTFALVVVLIALRFWVLRQQASFIWTAGAAIILFRFELCILFGLMLILELISGRLKLSQFLLNAVPAGLTWLGLTILVDSYFWQRWLWVEGEVLWFNTIMNKSSDWGTSPIWWYFSSALPRSLLLPLLLIPWGAYTDRRTLSLLFPAVGFIALYSLLPHKELRFIIYSIPLLNTVAAAGFSQLWKNRQKYSLVVPAGVMCSLLLTWGLSLVFLTTSINNYPGGHAFRTLHKKVEVGVAKVPPYSVHISVEAAMTGVSRFGETQSTWNYSKVEGLQPGSLEMMEFDFLLVSAKDYPHYNSTHYLVHKEAGFLGLSLRPREFPPVRIMMEDKIYILKRKGCNS